MEKTLGGDRLGSGKKLKVELHNYSRSTHDRGYLWRSTMSAGTLVPFICEVALPGDTFDINLEADIKTHPTVGPLFGSYKVQLDTFVAPMRLYQGQLHNNKLGVGLKMNLVRLPYLELRALPIPLDDVILIDLDNAQVNPSSILAYLGIRGIGHTIDNETNRRFNGIPLLAYWDIYKNYYANKQEEIGAVIHNELLPIETNVAAIVDGAGNPIVESPLIGATQISPGEILQVTTGGLGQDLDQVWIKLVDGRTMPITQLATLLIEDPAGTYKLTYNWEQYGTVYAMNWYYANELSTAYKPATVRTFPLTDIDEMREAILGAATSPTAFDIFAQNLEPYELLSNTLGGRSTIQQTQEGLAVKTYQSDLFNNWIKTEWIDGVDGITAITSIDTSGGSFSIDTLNLSKKVYDMLNRIAVSGGTYDDWLDAVYVHERYTRCESPMYMGGLIRELVFQEVISNSESESPDGRQPLGTLAGKGVMAKKHKGGHITIKIDEPSYIIGLISLTPRIDYSQGNKWDTHLETMDDLHKPALDEIGFQELITEQMAWWNTSNTVGGVGDWITKSAGKQPAWLNYMTNVNKTYGNFAIASNEMFMTLNRKYTPVRSLPLDPVEILIRDLTTYIDPAKYNNIFAQTSLDSQNFWAQISVDITYRGKISAKLIPNL